MTSAQRLEYARTLAEMVRKMARETILPRYLRAVREQKADGSVLTEADLASQAALVDCLPRLLPAPVLGEEMTAEEQGRVWHAGVNGLWVIDPIDGTTNFANGIPFFGVAVAYLVNHKTQIGVVYNPVTDEAFYAGRGAGAWLNDVPLPCASRRPTSRRPSPAWTSSASATTSATNWRCARPIIPSATSAPAPSNGATWPPAASTSICTAGRCCGTTPPDA
jgi:3'(2'), 5'-bisphosphate nucleotidase/myo-inositol-1(or 4)-monophosphatase